MFLAHIVYFPSLRKFCQHYKVQYALNLTLNPKCLKCTSVVVENCLDCIFSYDVYCNVSVVTWPFLTFFLTVNS